MSLPTNKSDDIKKFLRKCDFAFYVLGYENNIIKKPIKKIKFNRNKTLPKELNNFYKLIGRDDIKCIYKNFVFYSYKDIITSLNNCSEKHNLITIGEVNQGMGYSVRLKYSVRNKKFVFQTHSISSYCEWINSETLTTIIENNRFNKKYLFSKFKNVIRFIKDNASKYLDDVSFLHNELTINC